MNNVTAKVTVLRQLPAILVVPFCAYVIVRLLPSHLWFMALKRIIPKACMNLTCTAEYIFLVRLRKFGSRSFSCQGIKYVEILHKDSVGDEADGQTSNT